MRPYSRSHSWGVQRLSRPLFLQPRSEGRNILRTLCARAEVRLERLNALIAVMNLIWRRLAYMILAGMRSKLVRATTKTTGVTGGSFFHFDKINRPHDAAS